jgi:hypothetical protein
VLFTKASLQNKMSSQIVSAKLGAAEASILDILARILFRRIVRRKSDMLLTVTQVFISVLFLFGTSETIWPVHPVTVLFEIGMSSPALSLITALRISPSAAIVVGLPLQYGDLPSNKASLVFAFA